MQVGLPVGGDDVCVGFPVRAGGWMCALPD